MEAAPLSPKPAGGPTRLPAMADPARTSALRRAAEEMEASFLAEMLKSSGLGKTREGLGGGIGEDQFSSFMVTEQARAMAKAGGVGLAEEIFNTLIKRENHGK